MSLVHLVACKNGGSSGSTYVGHDSDDDDSMKQQQQQQGVGNLSELFSNQPKATLTVKLLLSTGLDAHSLREVRVFTSMGDAVAIRDLEDPQTRDKSSQFRTPGQAGNVRELYDQPFMVEFPARQAEKLGPPAMSIAFYQTFEDDGVTGGVRTLTTTHSINKKGPYKIKLPLGSIVEIYAAQPEVLRPYVEVEVTVTGLDPAVWIKAGHYPSVSSSTIVASPYTLPQLEARWSSQNSRLKQLGYEAEDPATDDIKLPFVCYGGSKVGVMLPFGPGFVTRFADQPVDRDTLIVLYGIGYLLTTGFADISLVTDGDNSNNNNPQVRLGFAVNRNNNSGDESSPSTLMFNESRGRGVKELLQTGGSLVSTFTPYMNDMRSNFDGSGKVRVEAPSYPLETQINDCEDDSGINLSISMSLKRFADFVRSGATGAKGSNESLLRLDPQLLWLSQASTDQGVTIRPFTSLSKTGSYRSVSPQDLNMLCFNLSLAMKNVSPHLVLVDHWRGGGFFGSHYAHASTMLLPSASTMSKGARASPSSSSRFATPTNGIDSGVSLEGVMIDSIHPLFTPLASRAKVVERETQWLDKLVGEAWSDGRAAKPLIKGLNYNDNIHVLKVFDMDGIEYVPLLEQTSNTNNTKKWRGCNMQDIMNSILDPFQPALSERERALCKKMSGLQYPFQPLTLTGPATLTLEFCLSSTSPAGVIKGPPHGRNHLAKLDPENEEVMTKLKHVLQQGLEEQTNLSHTIIGVGIRLPGLIQPSLILMSWSF